LRRKKDGEEKSCAEAHRFNIPWEPSLTAVTNLDRGQVKVTIAIYTELCESKVCHSQKKCLQAFSATDNM